MKLMKTKLGLIGLLVVSALVLNSYVGHNNPNIVSRKRIKALEWISKYDNGERRITKGYGPLLKIFIDEDGDNKIDELRVYGGFPITGPFSYKLRRPVLDDYNFDKEEKILSEY